jgi:hypothetical protein
MTINILYYESICNNAPLVEPCCPLFLAVRSHLLAACALSDAPPPPWGGGIKVEPAHPCRRATCSIPICLPSSSLTCGPCLASRSGAFPSLLYLDDGWAPRAAVAFVFTPSLLPPVTAFLDLVFLVAYVGEGGCLHPRCFLSLLSPCAFS